MDIKLHNLFLILICFGLGICNAQTKHKELLKLSEDHYTLGIPKMSESGKWFTVPKVYDRNTDTLLLIDNSQRKKKMDFRTKILDVQFLNDDYLLLKGSKHTELLNLKTKEKAFFSDVGDIKVIEDSNHFLMHYKKSSESKLEVYNSRAELIISMNNVKSYVIDKNLTYALRENEENAEIIVLNNAQPKVIYQSHHTIEFFRAVGDEYLMISERTGNTQYRNLIFLDITQNKTYDLSEILPLDYVYVNFHQMKQSNVFFLTMQLKSEKPDSSLVDIWYGSDKELDKKFVIKNKEVNYVWNPIKKEITKVGTEELEKSINLQNERYFASFDPYIFRDEMPSWAKTPLVLNIFDLKEKQYFLLDTINPAVYPSPDGEYILSPKNGNYNLYHIASKTKKIIKQPNLKTAYFSQNGKHIVFDSENGLWTYNFENNEIFEHPEFSGFQTKILNGDIKGLSNYNFYMKQIEGTSPLLIQLSKPHSNQTSYVLWDNSKKTTLIPFTENRIFNLSFNKSMDSFSYLEENYNLPPKLIFKRVNNNEKEIIFDSNPSDIKARSSQQSIHHYTTSEGVKLRGTLNYPFNYDATKKYPMVVVIYQVQSMDANLYPRAKYSNTNDPDGFNLRFFLENGYFVYYPDIVYGKAGTGLSALECVNKALDAISHIQAIDKTKIGLTGHSHGGYQTNFIATQSNRFAAYLSGAGNSDIIRSYFSFNYNFNMPFYYQFEDGQYEMKKSFLEDKDLYFKNNPIHYVDQVNAPIMLWTGMNDQNILWEQTREFYIGLKRNKKEVIALFYPNEDHSLEREDAKHDLIRRTLQWFNYFLKDEKDVDWINVEMKKDAV